MCVGKLKKKNLNFLKSFENGHKRPGQSIFMFHLYAILFFPPMCPELRENLVKSETDTMVFFSFKTEALKSQSHFVRPKEESPSLSPRIRGLSPKSQSQFKMLRLEFKSLSLSLKMH